MTRTYRYIATLLFSWLFLSSCGEYLQVQRSSNYAQKYSYAKKYYNMGKYRRAADLLTEVAPSYEGTSEGEQALFMLANSHYNLKEGDLASEYFQRYYRNYPKGDKAQEAHYKAAVSLYKMSPNAKLDQNPTYTAITELQSYLEHYPQSAEASDVKEMIYALQDKLAYKELLSAQLYYNMGTYLGNNYESAVITARNALQDYPFSKHKEDLHYVVLQSLFAEASNSVTEKMQMRFRNVIDQYYAYVSEFPEGKFRKQAEKIYQQSKKHISTQE